jgi:hypothetical protein
MFIYLVGFGYRYKICTIGEQRDVDEGRLCLGVLHKVLYNEIKISRDNCLKKDQSIDSN